MKKIALSQRGKNKGKYFALVDDADYEMLMQWRWCYANGYAVRHQYLNGKQKNIYMHRLIIGAKKGEEVDHINRKRLDNRRENLRMVTRSQNCRNRGGKGYYWNKKEKKWRAAIIIDKKQIHLGYFTTEQEAREAYLVEYKKCFE